MCGSYLDDYLCESLVIFEFFGYIVIEKRDNTLYLAHFVGTLFNWSRVWGLMHMNYVSVFIESLSSCI